MRRNRSRVWHYNVCLIMAMQQTINNTGILPDGNIVATKITLLPANTPTIDSLSHQYWIVNNYGDNALFDAADSIVLQNIGNATGFSPENLFLYQRSDNSDEQADWIEKDSALLLLLSSGPDAVFPADNFTSSGQLYIGTKDIVSTDAIHSSDPAILAYPNPLLRGNQVYFKNIQETFIFTIYDTAGKQLWRTNVQNGSETIYLPQGVYVYHIETADTMTGGKLIVY